MTVAYCWRTGLLEFSDHGVPSGALWIDTGSGNEWKEGILVICRRAYDGHSYLIPGVPEEDDDDRAMQAVQRFREWIEKRKEKTKAAQLLN